MLGIGKKSANCRLWIKGHSAANHSLDLQAISDAATHAIECGKRIGRVTTELYQS